MKLSAVAAWIVGDVAGTFVVFGNPLAPAIAILIGWSLPDPAYWIAPAIVGLWTAATIAYGIRKMFGGGWSACAFGFLFLVLPCAFATFHIDAVRRAHIAAFEADYMVQHSFWRSLWSGPQEYQFYLHAAAIKDCKPHAWSYRQMAFYPLPNNVAVNVLPRAWLDRCDIVRSRQ